MKPLLDLLIQCADLSKNSIVLADQDSADLPLVYVNDVFCNMTGYTREECLGKNCRFLQGEATNKLAVRSIKQALDNRESVFQDIINYRKNSESFWNRLVLFPIVGKEESYYYGCQHDVTKLKNENLEQSHFYQPNDPELKSFISQKIKNPLLDSMELLQDDQLPKETKIKLITKHLQSTSDTVLSLG